MTLPVDISPVRYAHTSAETENGCEAARHGTIYAAHRDECSCPEALALLAAEGLCGTMAGYQRHRRDGTTACRPCMDGSARYERGREWDEVRGTPRFVPALGAVRRVQGLMALGWSHRHLAKQLGVAENNLARLPRQKNVRRGFHEKVCALYDELSMTLGPSAQTRTIAVRRGYVVPLLWDEGTIDDPQAVPWRPRRDKRSVDEVAVQRAVTGACRASGLTPAEKAAAIRLLVPQVGYGETQRRLGVSGSTIRKALDA